MPLAILVTNECWRTKALNFIRINHVIFAAAGLLGIFKLLGGMRIFCKGSNFEEVGRFAEVADVSNMSLDNSLAWTSSQLLSSSTSDVPTLDNSLAWTSSQLHGLGPFLGENQILILLTLYGFLFFKPFASAGLAQLVAALTSKLLLRTRPVYCARVLDWFLFLGVINGVLIFVKVQHLPNRYLLPVSLVIIIYASFGLAGLYSLVRNNNDVGRLLKSILILIFVLLTIQIGLVLKPLNEKLKFEKNAVEYVSNARAGNVYYGSGKMRFYATGNTRWRKVDSYQKIKNELERTQKFDYLLLNVSIDDTEVENFINSIGNYEIIKEFDNGTDRKVVIWKYNR
jgi:hypothetical protein